MKVIDQLGLESKFSHLSMGGGASITLRRQKLETVRLERIFKKIFLIMFEIINIKLVVKRELLGLTIA